MKNKKCLNCGATESFIENKSKLGCAFCYISFNTEITKVFNHVQAGSTKHIGKVPKIYADPTEHVVANIINNSFIGDKDKILLKEKLGLVN